MENVCGCRTIHLPASHPKNSSSESPNKSSESPSGESKYFQEIGAEMIGNQLIIRVEKDKNKLRKKHGQWDPPCDCEIPEIRMSSGTEGPKIVNAGDNNQILFRIRSRTLIGKDDDNYKSEAFAYQLGATKRAKDSNDQSRTVTVHSQLGEPANSQDVHSDHITDGNQNIYLLRIKKNSETSGQKKRNIELEVRTPKEQICPVIQSKISIQKSEISNREVPKPPEIELEDEMKLELPKISKKVSKNKKKTKNW